MDGLGLYLHEKANEPFDWHSNNCMSFVSGALISCGHNPLPKEWCCGYDSALRAAVAYRRELAAYGHQDIIEAFDGLFSRETTLHPANGMICARKTEGVMGYAFGVAYRSNCFFLTEIGALPCDIEAGDIFWRIK